MTNVAKQALSEVAEVEDGGGGGGGGGVGGAGSLQQPAWFTPERLLLILCWINLLNYVDRGAIASNGVNGSQGNATCAADDDSCFPGGGGIVGDFSLSYFQDGILSSAFMVGLLVASPIFAELSLTVNPMRLIGAGLSIWTVATAGCGFSIGFRSIVFCRMLVGVAEASFISLAAPFIDDYAPPGKRTTWLSLFFSCIPVGVALGYVYGGLVGSAWGWRAAFWVESVFMLPFAALGCFSSTVHLKAQQQQQEAALLRDEERSPHGGASGGQWREKYFGAAGKRGLGFLENLKRLLAHKAYVINVSGYVAYNFVVGAYAYWGPKVGLALYGIKNADLVFGAVTIFSGILGTVFGGFALDRIGNTIPKAFKFLTAAMAIGGVLCFLAFSTSSLAWFVPLFAVGEFAIFATQGPVNFVNLHSVSAAQRPLAIAMCTVAIHIFGDVPSAPIVGLVQDLVKIWRFTALSLTSIFFLAAAIWASGCLLREEVRDKEEEPDYREEG